MKKMSLIGLGLILGLAGLSACSFEKKTEEPQAVPSAGTTEAAPAPMAVQPTPPQEGMAPTAPAAPTAPEATPPAPPAAPVQ